MIAQDIVGHDATIMIDAGDIKRMRMNSDVLDGWRMEGLQDLLREMALEGLGTMLGSHHGMRLSCLALHLVYDAEVGLMASSLDPLRGVLDSLSDVDMITGAASVPNLGCDLLLCMVAGFVAAS